MSNIVDVMKEKSIKGLKHWGIFKEIVEDNQNSVVVKVQGTGNPLFAQIYFHTQNHLDLEFEIARANNTETFLINKKQEKANIAHVFLKDEENFFVNGRTAIKRKRKADSLFKPSAIPEIPNNAEEYIALTPAEQKAMFPNKKGEKTLVYFREKTNEKPFRFEMYNPAPFEYKTAILTGNSRIFAPERETTNHKSFEYVNMNLPKENDVPSLRLSKMNNKMLFY